MDFEKIKPAVEEIRLSEIQQERIIEACEKHRKKGFNYKLWIPVAAALFVVIFSPGFIFRAGSKSADMAAPENGKGFYNYYAADEEMYVVEDSIADSVDSVQNQSTAVDTRVLFDSGAYRRIYSVIPSQFIWLVDYEEYENWSKTVVASDGMAMLQFVRYFNIAREDFESANKAYEAYLNGTGEGAIKEKPRNESEEIREIFNADIIYSFDIDTVNEYYLSDMIIQ